MRDTQYASFQLRISCPVWSLHTKARWYRVHAKVVVLDPSERKLHHGHRPPSINAPHIGEKCTYLMLILHAEAVGKISISFPLFGDAPFQKMVDCRFYPHLCTIHIRGGEPYAAHPRLLLYHGWEYLRTVRRNYHGQSLFLHMEIDTMNHELKRKQS